MELIVFSYAGLGLALDSWATHNQWHTLMADAGLYAIAPIVLAIRALSDGFFRPPGGPAGVWADYRITELRLMLAALVFLVAVVPAVSITPPAPDRFTGNHPPISTPQDAVKLPLFWAFVWQFSAGMANHLAVDYTTNLDAGRFRMLAGARLLAIRDPSLRAEVDRFYTDCFRPTYAKFRRDDFQLRSSTAVSSALSTYGVDDVRWMGSHVFLETPGYYAPCLSPPSCGGGAHAASPVSGWSFDWNNHLEVRRPHCREWWETASIGLRDRLYQTALDEYGYFFDTSTHQFQTFLSNIGLGAGSGASPLKKDPFVKTLLEGAPPNLLRTTRSLDTTLGEDAASAVGLGALAVFNTMVVDPVWQILTRGSGAIIAALLWVVVTVMPWALLLSGFDFRVVVVFAVAMWGINILYVFLGLVEKMGGRLSVLLYPPEAGPAVYDEAIFSVIVFGLYFLIGGGWAWALFVAGQSATGAVGQLINSSLQGLKEPKG